LPAGDLSEAVLFKHRTGQAREESGRCYWYLFRIDAIRKPQFPKLEDLAPFLRDDREAGEREIPSRKLVRDLFEASQLKIHPEQIQALFATPSPTPASQPPPGSPPPSQKESPPTVPGKAPTPSPG
jgi:hypothetical protein